MTKSPPFYSLTQRFPGGGVGVSKREHWRGTKARRSSCRKALVTNPTVSANLLKTTCGAAASNFARA